MSKEKFNPDDYVAQIVGETTYYWKKETVALLEEIHNRPPVLSPPLTEEQMKINRENYRKGYNQREGFIGIDPVKMGNHASMLLVIGETIEQIGIKNKEDFNKAVSEMQSYFCDFVAPKPRDYIKEMRQEGVEYLAAIFNKADEEMESKERNKYTMDIFRTTGNLLYYASGDFGFYSQSIDRRIKNRYIASKLLWS